MKGLFDTSSVNFLKNLMLKYTKLSQKMALPNGALNFNGQIKIISGTFSCYFWGYRVIIKR
jgi:hypothetical protein